MNKVDLNLLCIKCGESIILANHERLICSNCGSIYPILEKNIPIFLPNVTNQMQSDFKDRLGLQKQILQYELNECSVYVNQRPVLSKKCEAIRKHITLLNQMIATIDGIKAPRAKTKYRKTVSDDNSYSSMIPFYIRDWSRKNEMEKEVQSILRLLRHAVRKHPHRTKPLRICYLGAGACRFATEFADKHHVTAVELSLESASLFHLFRSGKWNNFSWVNDYGYLDRQSIVVKHNFRKNDAKKAKKVQYMVADAQKLPFKPNSFDIVVSCYFLDVLPISTFLDSVTSVIKENGLLVNVGPLRFHFSHPLSNLSLSELKDFISNKFYFLTERLVKMNHVKIRQMETFQFLNWFFIAKKMGSHSNN